MIDAARVTGVVCNPDVGQTAAARTGLATFAARSSSGDGSLGLPSPCKRRGSLSVRRVSGALLRQLLREG